MSSRDRYINAHNALDAACPRRGVDGGGGICGGSGEIDTDADSDAGFTIIELMVAFTILAIISGSLFQMFFVSSRNNARAVDMDMANSLAITAVELFKADPELGGDRFVKYYDSRWRELELEFELAAPGAETRAPEGAGFILEAVMSESRDIGPELNYVSASVSLSLDSTQNYRLVVNENAGDVEVVFNGVPRRIEKSRIGRIISINIEYSGEGVLPKHVAVVNRTGYMVNINVFGIPGSGYNVASDAAAAVSGSVAGSGGSVVGGRAADGGGSAVGSGALESSVTVEGGGVAESSGSAAGFIEVSPVSGSISIMYLNDHAHAADSLMRTIEVSVRETQPGGAELAHVEAKKYIPG
ncbi:MAG: prepilin-type N-terminal cleavage/methylation domain-containing protein [Oscillospiraceae bacterium]|nr:prepilin-type N-terminal cleavage/methylation domain-containing protein [Oscillospiraceae bacterium]